MPKDIILVGDTTSHRGVVISGSEADTINGRPIARKGDLVDCPEKYANGRPHGINPIVEGDESMLMNGRPVALEGHRTECGCVLIGSGNGSID
jgi:uncharacterized Zn-binding protein involved in type VI secretion